LQSYSFTSISLLTALLTITLVVLKITLSFKKDTLFVNIVLVISKVAFVTTATLKFFEKLLYINIALRQL
jgi:hypothetical protein